MFKRLFVDHPESVGESYFEHMGVAFSFGFAMLGGALACIIHGFIPGIFKSTGSKTIQALHQRLVLKRGSYGRLSLEPKATSKLAQMRDQSWLSSAL
jgi:hypothetical protein